MVIAHHLIWTNYGTWLPNDPRGSGSQQIATPRLAELGELHHGRRKIQPATHVLKQFRAIAEPELKFNVIRFDAAQIASVAGGLADGIRQHGYTCYACVVMPDHVHVLIRKHKHPAEMMIENLQDATRLRLCSDRLMSPASSRLDHRRPQDLLAHSRRRSPSDPLHHRQSAANRTTAANVGVRHPL